MKATAIISRIRTDIQNLGVVKTGYEILMEGINVLITFRIFKAMKIETVNPKYLESSEPLEWRFIEEPVLLELAENPENKLTEDFVRNATSRGDQCYGALDNGALAACGWYSNQPTDDNGLDVHFSRDYIYMYAGFTHPNYRGKRLHAIGMNRALREYLDRGYKGLVSHVESHNFRSLQSVYRMGYQDIGKIFVIKLGGLAWMHSSRGCREHGFYVAKPAAAPQAPKPVLTS